MADIVYADESYKIVGACFNVYNDKGSGFLEAVYQECLEIELEFQNIPFIAQKELDLFYRARKLSTTYKVDVFCFDKILVEIKAVGALTGDHRAQALNYLNATGMKLCLLVNFGNCRKLEYERILL